MKATTQILNEILKTELTYSGMFCHKEKSKRLVLGNGEGLSVQASKGHYCKPRDDTGPYYEVEVGYPSVEPPESWKDYFDGNWETGDRKQSVYGYVPIDLVVDFINDNGGLKEAL